MSDIVQRLRRKTVAGQPVFPTPLDIDAANEIERLRARVGRDVWRAHDEYAALVAAARKVTCERCGGSTCAPEHGRGIPAPGTCPDCDDLRRLLEEKP